MYFREFPDRIRESLWTRKIEGERGKGGRRKNRRRERKKFYIFGDIKYIKIKILKL